MPKINWLFLVWALVLGLLIYSRFVNLAWGLPYPFHPDERNMAVAVANLSWQDRLNPHFFAYGQFPLYLAAVLSFLTRLSPTLSLRLISAIASVLTFFILLRILKTVQKKLSPTEEVLASVILTISPYAIQFAHFGTTESLLMLFYSLIVYQLLKGNVFLISLFSGLAIATKVSAGIFLAVPLVFFLSKPKKLLLLLILSGAFFVIFSPHNLINVNEFIGSMRYESDIALGKIVVFYTRQFVDTVPILFQTEKIFPYALGFFQFVIFIFGFFFLPWKDKKINLLRAAFLFYFLPNSFLFSKWVRFMAPAFPLMTTMALIFILRIKNKIIIYGLIIAMAIPGLLYLSVYQKPDARLAASNWIHNNIPENSYILSETANVVDIPVAGEKNYQVISFDFYELENSPSLQSELTTHLAQADYILVPSRRIFANHPKETYPRLSRYYDDLFSGRLGFTKVAEFSAGLKDEEAEETWTVFDHPVVRIYKRN